MKPVLEVIGEARAAVHYSTDNIIAFDECCHDPLLEDGDWDGVTNMREYHEAPTAYDEVLERSKF